MAKNESRPERWNKAVADLRATFDQIETLKEELAQGFEALRELVEEYGDWRDNMPEGLDASPTADKLDAIRDMDFSWDAGDDLSDAESLIDDAENADLPRGFGRD